MISSYGNNRQKIEIKVKKLKTEKGNMEKKMFWYC